MILTTLESIILSTFYSLVYLSSIYLHPSSRISINNKKTTTNSNDSEVEEKEDKKRDRNTHSVIKSRLIAVSLANLLSLLSVPLLLYYKLEQQAGNLTNSKQLNLSSFLSSTSLPSSTTSSIWSISSTLLGLLPPSSSSSTSSTSTIITQIIIPTITSSLLTISLFTGSIYLSYLSNDLPFQNRSRFSWRGLKEELTSWEGIRNYFVGPITEEIQFRSILITISKLSNLSNKKIILFSPLYFGLAHIHHVREIYIKGGRTFHSLKIGIIRSLFQLTYTSLFGSYATYLFLRTGSIYPPIISHSICNYLGFPMIGIGIQLYPTKKIHIIGMYTVGIILFSFGLNRFMSFSDLLGLEEGSSGSIYWN